MEENETYNYWISYEDWKAVRQTCKGVILNNQEERRFYLVSFSVSQAQNYTCDHLCSINTRCTLVKRLDQQQRFARGVCVVSRGPRRDSMVTGLLG